MANFGGARFASSKSPELRGARFASSESPEFRGVRVSVSPKIVIFVKNALKIPLKKFSLRRAGGCAFHFLDFSEMGGARFASSF